MLTYWPGDSKFLHVLSVCLCLGWAMGCLFWIQRLIYALLLMSCSMQNGVILDHVTSRVLIQYKDVVLPIKEIPFVEIRRSYDHLISRSSYLQNGISYTAKITALHWISSHTHLCMVGMYVKPVFANALSLALSPASDLSVTYRSLTFKYNIYFTKTYTFILWFLWANSINQNSYILILCRTLRWVMLLIN